MPKPGFCAETLFPRPLQEGILFDVLEVFSGSKVWTRAHVQLGSSAHPGVDTAAPPPFGADLRDKRVFQELLALVLRRVVGEFHFGPPCRTFGLSVARDCAARIGLQASAVQSHSQLSTTR